jgi:hypothetical protein
MKSVTAQREGLNEDELTQMKSTTAQRQDMEEDDLTQMKSITAQRQNAPEEDELLQRIPVQRRANATGMPDQLKSGIEGLSGLSMDGVQVHYNSSKPASLQAHAYTQGSDIHVAPGQEQHLPHEAWHVVQQAQGRVQPTMQLQGTAVNDDPGLENEADVMGAKALQMASMDQAAPQQQPAGGAAANGQVYQRVSSGAVAQLVYLWDRADEDDPIWSEDDPPPNYLLSGRYNDGDHGRDDLYARLRDSDLFYGVSYEEQPDELEAFLAAIQKIGEEKVIDVAQPDGFAQAIQIYESEGGTPLLDVTAMTAMFGGSSGWERYPSYIPEGNKKGSMAATSTELKRLNPDLPWATNSLAGQACQVTMIEAIKRGGSVRFLLDGMTDIKGVLEQTSERSNKITAHELRFACELLNQRVETSNNEQDAIVPAEGVNVFFYLNRRLIPAAWLEKIEPALAMARKLAEEEEWDDEDEAEGLYDLMEALAAGLTGDQLEQALQLP